jgi:hypothetical protein
VQYSPSDSPPERCIICEDERQYVGWGGQRWATMEELLREGRQNVLREEEPNLYSLETQPAIAIGQRALIARTPHGNVMWDCVSLVDDAGLGALREIVGLAAIAISHPHFYAAMCTWSAAIGNCPIYIHAADRQWVTYPAAAVTFWEGVSREILPGVRLVNTGGHFEGATVLHLPAGAEGRGILLSGDTATVVMDRRYVSFMYSYPNLIPLGEAAINRIVETLRPYKFERVYGGWNGRVVAIDGSDAIERSAERYLRFIRGESP